MNRFIVLFIGIVLSINCFSQDSLFVMHPLVGDTIDKNEKMSYLLFPQIKDSDFKYCFITYSNDQYFVNSYTVNDSVSRQPIDTVEIRQYMVKLDKLLAYYSNKAQKDSLKSGEKLDLNFKGVNPNYVNGNLVGEDARERILEEVRRDNRMKGDAERFKNTKQGTDLFGGGGHIEFFKSKHKK